MTLTGKIELSDDVMKVGGWVTINFSIVPVDQVIGMLRVLADSLERAEERAEERT